MGETLTIRPDRYDVSLASGSFALDSARADDGFVRVEVLVEPDHDVELLLEAQGGEPAVGIAALARRVLMNLNSLDLIVQKHCADACERSKIDSDHFESWLAVITIRADTVTLEYWGDVVNTQWDEVFSRGLDGWVHTRAGMGRGTGHVVALG